MDGVVLNRIFREMTPWPCFAMGENAIAQENRKNATIVDSLSVVHGCVPRTVLCLGVCVHVKD
eukprot:scaffold5378_cov107-Isochrysis_galbana.AAC.3